MINLKLHVWNRIAHCNIWKCTCGHITYNEREMEHHWDLHHRNDFLNKIK